jgi:hypothetical protein
MEKLLVAHVERLLYAFVCLKEINKKKHQSTMCGVLIVVVCVLTDHKGVGFQEFKETVPQS